MSKDKVVWRPGDGITLTDIEMNRHFPEVQAMVQERINEQQLDPNNIDHGQQILDIWKQVVLEWKRFM